MPRPLGRPSTVVEAEPRPLELPCQQLFTPDSNSFIPRLQRLKPAIQHRLLAQEKTKEHSRKTPKVLDQFHTMKAPLGFKIDLLSLQDTTSEQAAK